ncbi:hypothetical protein OG905_02600 [Streptomyces sp. NBC_00322]|uniref:hypothetical protein n=1 Tax=Streptomyces sp. NBC_00322 TaxID=2975712 RepID=UPI002E27D379|nr:hypothetical protein [Streptomyces sp. NBC_00322]
MNTSSTPHRSAGKLVRGLVLVSAGVLTAVTGVIIWAVSTVGGGPALVAATVVLAAPWAIIHWVTTRARTHHSTGEKGEEGEMFSAASPPVPDGP